MKLNHLTILKILLINILALSFISNLQLRTNKNESEKNENNSTLLNKNEVSSNTHTRALTFYNKAVEALGRPDLKVFLQEKMTIKLRSGSGSPSGSAQSVQSVQSGSAAKPTSVNSAGVLINTPEVIAAPWEITRCDQVLIMSGSTFADPNDYLSRKDASLTMSIYLNNLFEGNDSNKLKESIATDALSKPLFIQGSISCLKFKHNTIDREFVFCPKDNNVAAKDAILNAFFKFKNCSQSDSPFTYNPTLIDAALIKICGNGEPDPRLDFKFIKSIVKNNLEIKGYKVTLQDQKSSQKKIGEKTIEDKVREAMIKRKAEMENKQDFNEKKEKKNFFKYADDTDQMPGTPKFYNPNLIYDPEKDPNNNVEDKVFR